VLYEDARKQAKELDAEFASTKTLRGPFHGVPVSVKDNFTSLHGYDATIGFTAWANNPGKKDACASAGAIIFVKTNVPQTMLAFECSNPLWGRTTNPWNNKYTCGGSSGGEGALLAMDGSALGIGSDIGGSLRIPASYCGVYSLKPTAERVSSIGTQGR
ncbi:amidase, partial [Suillus spraguei]